jgi:hypothetical protein
LDWSDLKPGKALLPVAAVLCSLAVYLSTLAPTAFPLDSAEMASGAATLGIVHAPGYPVYLLLTHLFTHLPIGDIAYRANLASAVYASLSVGLLVVLVRDMTGRTLPAMIAGLGFAFCFYTWSLSVVAEVYTLQALLLIIMLLALWRWRQSGGGAFLLSVALVAGLAAANNPATVLWWPGLLLIIWTSTTRQSLRRSHMIKLAAAFLLGLAFILYIPIRSAADPVVNYIGQFDSEGIFHRLDLSQPKNLLWYLSGKQFGWAFFAYSGSELLQQAGRFGYQLFGAFFGAGLVIAGWGAWHKFGRQRWFVAGLLLVAASHSLFFIAYRVPDKETMFLPVYLATAVFLGLGAARIEYQWPVPARLTLPLLIVAMLAVNRPYADASELTLPGEVAQARLGQAEPDAFYLAVWGDAAAMEYLQVAEGRRTDVKVINILMIPPDTRQELVQDALQNGKTVYSSFVDPALKHDFEMAPVEHGYRVSDKSSQ